MSQPLDENSLVREYGSEHSSGAGKPRPIGCVCGRKLMVAAVHLARMSCTQRQRSDGAERDDANNPTILSLTCGTHKRWSHLFVKERQGKAVIATSEDPCPRRGTLCCWLVRHRGNRVCVAVVETRNVMVVVVQLPWTSSRVC